jgi:hypothetical protein
VELLLAVVAPLSLIVGFALAFGHSRRQVTGTVAQAKKGERLRIAGRVVADKPLTSPVAGERCVYWHMEIRSRSSRSGETDNALARDGQSLKREHVDTDRSSEWADGLRIEDSTGSLLLNPIGGRMETTRGTELTAGLFTPNERIQEIVRKHGGAGVEAEANLVQERLLEVGANVVAEGVVEDIKGRLFLGGEGRFSLEPAQQAAPPSSSTVWLGRGLIAFAVLCGVILIASCGPPRSDNPLSDPSKAKMDPKLVGRWSGTKDKQPVFFQVSEKENGVFDAVLVAQDEKKGAVVLTFEGFSTELNGKRYMNLRPKTATDDYGEHWDVKPRYLFVLYSVANGALSLSLMDEELMKAAVAGGKLKGRLDGDDLILTEETAKLAEFVSKADSAKLFQPFATLKALR